MGTQGFAYMRDPVPHMPPRFLGFRSAQSLLYHIYIEQEVWLKDAVGEDFDLVNYVKYSKAYKNEGLGDYSGDKLFAGATSTYSLGDHLKYFKMNAVQISCGMFSEDFVFNQYGTS